MATFTGHYFGQEVLKQIEEGHSVFRDAETADAYLQVTQAAFGRGCGHAGEVLTEILGALPPEKDFTLVQVAALGFAELSELVSSKL